MLMCKRKKPLLVFVGSVCFGLGIVFTHFIINILIDAPNKILKKDPEKDVFLQENTSDSAQILMLSIALPPPPSSSQIQGVNPRPKSLDKPDLIQKMSAQINKQTLSTLDENVVKLGLYLLNNTPQKNVPDIQIALPNHERDREKIIAILRQCLGVKLGKINSNGDITAQETDVINISPYLRLVDGNLTKQETIIAKNWLQVPGTFVRFYPKNLDAKIFGGLSLVMNERIESKYIKGEYSLSAGVLKLINIEINNKKQTKELILGKNCSSS